MSSSRLTAASRQGGVVGSSPSVGWLACSIKGLAPQRRRSRRAPTSGTFTAHGRPGRRHRSGAGLERPSQARAKDR
jgi:hypothetical protein